MLSFVLMQLGWFACVLGIRWQQPWIGPIVVALLTARVLWPSSSTQLSKSLRFLILVAALGFAVDSLLLHTSVLLRADGQRFAPLWLVALWPNFALAALPGRTLWPLRLRPAFAALLGALAGPLAYRGGANLALGAVTVGDPSNLLVIAIVWAWATPTILWGSQRLHR